MSTSSFQASAETEMSQESSNGQTITAIVTTTATSVISQQDAYTIAKLSTTSSPPPLIRRTITLFENERYLAFSGFTSSGLLPTDRSWISTADGLSGFSSYNEAQSAFVTYGWRWESSWVVDMNTANVDGEGWSYSSDFASMGENGGYREKVNHIRGIWEVYGGIRGCVYITLLTLIV